MRTKSKPTCIVDYGVGNIGSILNMMKRLGFDAVLTGDPTKVENASRILLPGVGAFDSAVSKLQHRGLDDAIKSAAGRGASILGVCLGMQLLLDGSEEGELPGLGLIQGTCRLLPAQISGQKFTVPHMGWNTVKVLNPSSALPSIESTESRYYFVHSYYANPSNQEDIVAQTSYGIDFASVIGRGRVSGAQFHPEKSHRYGMALMKDFLTEEERSDSR